MSDWPSWVWIILFLQVITFWAVTRIDKHLQYHHKVVVDYLYPPSD